MRRGTTIAVIALATLTACNPHVVPGPAPEAALLPCAASGCLRVLTWNVHAIPFVSPRPQARLRNVAAKIREQRPDVVLLQEVWAHAYARELGRRLARDYRVVTASGCGRPFPCGGLAILVARASSFVPSTPTFVPYADSAPWYRLAEWDGIAKKGILMVELARGADRLAVADTHLQTGYARSHRDYSDIRRRQLIQLAATLDARFGARPVIVGGDFNTAPGEQSGLYETHVATLGDDCTSGARAACGACGTRPSPRPSGRWLDYVLARNLAADAAGERIRNAAVDDPFSDHDGVLVRLVRRDRARAAAAATW